MPLKIGKLADEFGSKLSGFFGKLCTRNTTVETCLVMLLQQGKWLKFICRIWVSYRLSILKNALSVISFSLSFMN